MDFEAPQTLTVADLTARSKRVLATQIGKVSVIGEVTQPKVYGSGHCYFTLADQHRDAKVSAVMFKSNLRRGNITPQHGDVLVVEGRVELYEPAGRFQLIVERVQHMGDGLLHAEYEALKRRLQADGLFDQPRRPLPAPPQHIALVTSLEGAVLHDVCQRLKEHAPLTPITVFGTAVQGDAAPPQIMRAIGAACAYEPADLPPPDVILLCRGGGSFGDLWAFSNEMLVRMVASLPICCVVGVGHETDTSLCDLVADVRASTPTAAASLVSQVQSQWPDDLRSLELDLARSIRDTVETAVQQCDDGAMRLSNSAAHPRAVQDARQRLTAATMTLRRPTPVAVAQATLNEMQVGLRRNSPQAALGRNAAKLTTLSQRLDVSGPASVRHAGFAPLARLQGRLKTAAPGALVAQSQARIAQATAAISQSASRALEKRAQSLALAASALSASDPHAPLKKGYAMMRDADTGQVISHPTQVKAGQHVVAEMAQGRIHSTVDKVSE